LVNRRLAHGGAGLDFIDRLKADESLCGVSVMLVSDRADAQKEAVGRGALPGFGKAALNAPLTAERLGAVLQNGNGQTNREAE
jgi:hypothetical protein